MANKYVDADDERWKRKYYDILGELEKKEGRFQQAESLLRNALIRISLGVETDNKKLNKQLDKLREYIRNGEDVLKLRKAFDEVADAIKNIQARETATPEHTVESVLHDVIHKIDWPRVARADQEKISKQFTPLRESDIPKFISLMSTLINRSFLHYQSNADEAEMESVKTENKEVKEESKPANVERAMGQMLLVLLNKLPASMVDESIIRRLKLLAAKCESREQALQIIDGIVAALIPQSLQQEEGDIDVDLAANLLIEFLEQIILPVELSVRAEELRENLIENKTKEQIMLCLEGSVEIVTQMQMHIRDERKELEKFLEQISERLAEIDQQLKSLAGISDKHREGLEKVNEEVGQATAAIEDALTSTEDLDALKTAVKSHVIMIRQHLDTYFEGETVTNTENDRIVKQLAKELIAVKREAESLREQLEQRRLEATHDPLTRIPNRLAYQEWIEQEHSRFEKYDTPFVLMVWDVDFFKKINDNYGHLAGDKVLRIVAQVLAEQVREADFVARYGGEEFVIVMPGTTQQPAMAVAEKIRKAISECAFHFRQEPVSITASCGVAEVRAGESIDDIFHRADEALYKAKQSGRNTCIAA